MGSCGNPSSASLDKEVEDRRSKECETEEATFDPSGIALAELALNVSDLVVPVGSRHNLNINETAMDTKVGIL